MNRIGPALVGAVIPGLSGGWIFGQIRFWIGAMLGAVARYEDGKDDEEFKEFEKIN